MNSTRALRRIAVNVAWDAALAAAAVPLAAWLAQPDRTPPLGPGWLALGIACLLLAGLPFRLPLQYWRFTAMAELLGVAAASVTAATLFTLARQMLRAPLPSPAFPVLHFLCLTVLLGLPRMAYRMLQERRAQAAGASRPVLLVGAGEGADLFLRALAADPAPRWRPIGLLSLGQAQTGRRIHGYPILGSVGEADSILAGLERDDRAPTLVLTEADLPDATLAGLTRAAGRAGARVARVPQPTALMPQT